MPYSPGEVLQTRCLKTGCGLSKSGHQMENLCSSLLDFAGDGVFRCRFADGTIISCNQGLATLLGVDLPPAELVGRKLDEFIQCHDKDAIRADLETSGVVRRRECRVSTVRGEERWLLRDSVLNTDTATGERVIDTVVRDVTALRCACDAIRREKAVLESTLRHIGDGVVTVDAAGRIVMLNPAAAAMSGCKAETAAGRPFGEVFRLKTGNGHHAVLKGDKAAAALEAVLKGGEKNRIAEALLLAADGAELQVVLKVAAIGTAPGGGAVIVLHDQTETRLAAQALQESDSRYRGLMETTTEGIWVVDPQARTTFVNARILEMLGYAGEDMIGRKMFDFLQEDFLRNHEARLKKLAKSPRDKLDMQFRRAAGGDIWLAVSTTMLSDAKGRFMGLLAMVTDLTQQLHSESARKQSESRLQSILNSISDIVLTIDEDGRYSSYFCERPEELLLKPQDFLGKMPEEVMPPELTKLFSSAFAQNRQGLSVAYEYSLSVKGRDLWFSARQSPIMVEGKFSGAVVVARNETERRQMQLQLQQERNLLSVTLEAINEGVISTDVAGNVMFMNLAAGRMTGWDGAQAAGKPLQQVCSLTHPKTRKAMPSIFDMLAQAEGHVMDDAREAVLTARDGTQRLVANSGAQLCLDDGCFVGVVYVFRDITREQMQLDERLRASKFQSLSALAGGVAHDFNNIMTAVLGNVSLAQFKLPPDAEARKLMAEAQQHCLQARALTHQLLTFSRGGAMPVRETTSLRNLVVDTALLVLSGSNVKCECKVPENLWPANIDKSQMAQVISNLVMNAQEAMPEGGSIEIRCENVTIGPESSISLPEGNYVRIAIQDQGMGISANDIDRIFDPYFSTRPSRSGLGLSVSYSIVKKHNGLIITHSELGVGTEICIYLPAAKPGTDAAGPASGQPRKAVAPEDVVVGKSGRILFMDDEEIVLKTVGGLLQMLGYQVEYAHDGREAVEIYEKARRDAKPFLAVILDLTVPGGIGAREAIKKLLQLDPEVTAIVSSGYADDPLMVEYKLHGFKGAIAKPYEISELSQVLETAVKT